MKRPETNFSGLSERSSSRNTLRDDLTDVPYKKIRHLADEPIETPIIYDTGSAFSQAVHLKNCKRVMSEMENLMEILSKTSPFLLYTETMKSLRKIEKAE